MMFTTKSSREAQRVREAARSSRRRRFFGCEELEDRVVPTAFVYNATALDETFKLQLVNNRDILFSYSSSAASFSQTLYAGAWDSIVINTGGGRNTTSVLGTNIPVYINDGGSADNDIIGGDLMGVSSILANVTCTNSGGRSLIKIDDTNNNNFDRKMGISNNSVTGLPGGSVYFNQNQIYALNILSGSRRNDYSVTDTPNDPSANVGTAIFNYGSGNNIFWVTGTTGPVYFQGVNGYQSVNVGTDIRGNRLTTAAIKGDINVRDAANGWSQLLIDNGTSQTAQTVNINKNSITGIAPATINFATNTTPGSVVGGVYTLAVTGSYNSTINVYDLGADTNAITTSSGDDNVNVYGTHGDLTIFNYGGHDNVGIGTGGTMANVFGRVTVDGSGLVSLFLLDYSETVTHTMNMWSIDSTTGAVEGLSPARVTWKHTATPDPNRGVVFIQILGSAAASQYNFSDTSSFYYSTDLVTGASNDGVSVFGTTGPLNLYNGGGYDKVGLGSNGSMVNINGPVNIASSGITEVSMDDSTDSVKRTITTNSSPTQGWIDGIAPARVSWTGGGGVSYVEVKTGAGGAAITVLNTSLLLRGTMFFTGSGDDTVSVSRTTGGLFFANAGGNDTYVIGRGPNDTSGDVSKILSYFAIDSSTKVKLTVDDSANTTVRNVTLAQNPNSRTAYYRLSGLNNSSLYSDGLLIAANAVASLTIKGGNGGSVYNINDIAMDSSARVFINSGSGNDVINIGGPSNKLDSIVGTFSVSNRGGTDTLNVLDQASTSNNTYTIGSNSFARSGKTSVDWTGFNAVNLKGGAGNDTYTVTGIPGSGVKITDAGGNDKLVGPNATNAWSITGSNVVTLGTQTFNFAESLVGGSGDDSFAFKPGGQITGSLDGGSGGSNTLDYSAVTTPVLTNLAKNTSSGIGGTFANMLTVIGGTNAGNRLQGSDLTATYWMLSGQNAGSVRNFNFSNFPNLVGGAGDDYFIYDAGASITGTIDGGGGSGNGLDGSLTPSRTTVYPGSSQISLLGGTFQNLKWLKSSQTAGGTINGATGLNTFRITGPDKVTLGNLNYAYFNNLVGSTDDDRFIFSKGASLSGSIDGGSGGYNTLDYSAMTDTSLILYADGVQQVFDGLNTITGSFANIQNVIGSVAEGSNPNYNELWGYDDGNASDWIISGGLSGSVRNLNFSNFGQLNGGGGNDNFRFVDGGYVELIYGGDGVNTIDLSAKSTSVRGYLDSFNGTSFYGFQFLIGSASAGGTLTGPGGASTYNITGANAGNVGGLRFSNFSSLVAGDGNDIFNFSAAASLGGSIDGGGGVNTIDESVFTTPVSLNLAASTLTGLGATFANIQTITPGSGANTLTGPAAASTYNITGKNSGSVGTFNFTKFGTLIGGANNDVFKFTSAGLLSGGINGGDGTDSIDDSALTTAVTLNLATSSITLVGGSLSNIENVIGGSNTGNQIVGPATATTFNITGANIGNAAGISFTSFRNLVGGAGNDVFKFSNAATLTGAINGGGGTNTVDFSAYTTATGVNLLSTKMTGLGGVFSSIQSFIGGTNSGNQIAGPNTATVFNVTGPNTENVNGISFSGFGNLSGGTANDTFVFSAGASITGGLNGGAGTNTLNLSAFTTTVSVNLSNNRASGLGASFASIQSFIGGINVSNSVTGPAAGTTFNITALNTFNANSLNFSNFRRITGGVGQDIFVLSDGAGLSGLIDGGAGNNWLDYGAYTTAVTANLTTGAATGFGGALANIVNVRGGSANDKLTGNSKGNILIGGAGNDTLIGGSGRSLLIGGTGVDTVTGGAGDDLVIGLSTTLDNNNTALDSILAEWQSTTDSYATRINFIKNGGGLNGSNKLNLGTTVIDDLAANVLTGGSTSDWFFKGTKDTITDLNSGEQVN